MKKSIIIGTAGHIDHGKTALVKALTGVDADRLPEEKARGITIDIGFAHADLSDAELSFIDVPGHERFVKNMLAGIGGIDLVMLIVAADESVMPQTREHFEICRLLGISRGVVVITKKDLVDEEMLAVVRQDVADLVRGSFLEAAPLFAVSSKSGEGVEALKEGLAGVIQSLQQRRSDGVFRLPVDRVFTLKGHGTIVTGTLISGRIRRDRFAEILPFHRRVRVRSIHAHNHSVEEAVAGQRTALNLQGITKDEMERGDTLTEPDFFDETSLLDVRLTLLQNSKPVTHNSILRFHHLTNDMLARITLLGQDVLMPGESGFAQLRLQRPLFALRGDRFILRSHSPLITVGGGWIIDHLPQKRSARGDRNARERLIRLETATEPVRLAIAVAQCGIRGAEERYLKAKLALYPEDLLRLRTGAVVFLRERPILAMERTALETLIARIHQVVSEFHTSHPLLPGISKEELRTRFFAEVPEDPFAAVLEAAVQEKKLQVHKETVSVYGRAVVLTGEQEAVAAQAEAILLRVGLEFPGLDELSKQLKLSVEAGRKILYVLVRQGRVFKVADDYFLHRKTWDQLKSMIRERKPKQRTFSVPDFKALFGVSRKYAIPLLEQLDQEGITRRSGNERIIL